jgi:hypothetical protein
LDLLYDNYSQKAVINPAKKPEESQRLLEASDKVTFKSFGESNGLERDFITRLLKI